jgi:hypothetical protein
MNANAETYGPCWSHQLRQVILQTNPRSSGHSPLVFAGAPGDTEGGGNGDKAGSSDSSDDSDSSGDSSDGKSSKAILLQIRLTHL